jgi:Tfp pilus assembly protein PilF
VATGAVFAGRRDTPFARATAHLQAGEFEPAVAELDRELAAHPEDVRAHLLRGSALLLAHRYEPAIADLTEVIRLEPKKALPYSLRATAWSETGELEKALADYDKAVELEPKRGDYLHARAFVHYRLGHDDAAEADWRRAADSQRDREVKAGSLENIGLIYVRRGEWRAALDHTQAVDRVRAGMTWNAFFQWIAADQLGLADSARAAEAIWWQHRAEADVQALRGLLPETLQHYLEDPPKAGTVPDSIEKPGATQPQRGSRRSSRRFSAAPAAEGHYSPALGFAITSRSASAERTRSARGAAPARRRIRRSSPSNSQRPSVIWRLSVGPMLCSTSRPSGRSSKLSRPRARGSRKPAGRKIICAAVSSSCAYTQ